MPALDLDVLLDVSNQTVDRRSVPRRLIFARGACCQPGIGPAPGGAHDSMEVID
jgi:hypothetical protein